MPFSAVSVLLALAFPLAAQADRTVVVRLTSVTLFNTPYDLAPNGAERGRPLRREEPAARTPFPSSASRRAPSSAPTGAPPTLVSKTVMKSVGVAKLPGGTIRFQGTGRLGARTSIPVVGGTGDYAGARGTLVGRAGREHRLNTYTLKLPGSA